jgi:hypothetical protein
MEHLQQQRRHPPIIIEVTSPCTRQITELGPCKALSERTIGASPRPRSLKISRTASASADLTALLPGRAIDWLTL